MADNCRVKVLRGSFHRIESCFTMWKGAIPSRSTAGDFVTSGKSVNLSLSQFHHLWNIDVNNYSL